jgi:hypothetical protein
MRTALLSIWRNDGARQLEARAAALLAKTGPDLGWLWVVGDSADDTEVRLRALAVPWPVRVLRADSGITSDEPAARLARMSYAGDGGLAVLAKLVGPDAPERVVMHESDLESPVDVVAQLDGDALTAVAGWPTLTLPTGTVFYDLWAYVADGTHFTPDPPYHARYRPDARFPVDSAGSVLSFPAWVLRDGAREGGYGLRGLCQAMRQRGVGVLVDPRVPIIQPATLWAPQVGAEVPAWT